MKVTIRVNMKVNMHVVVVRLFRLAIVRQINMDTFTTRYSKVGIIGTRPVIHGST